MFSPIVLLVTVILVMTIGLGGLIVDRSRLKNRITATEADLNAWKHSCSTLEASIRRYEELCKGNKHNEPPLKPMPISSSSTDRWRKVTLE